jgi:hypothetical protein
VVIVLVVILLGVAMIATWTWALWPQKAAPQKAAPQKAAPRQATPHQTAPHQTAPPKAAPAKSVQIAPTPQIEPAVVPLPRVESTEGLLVAQLFRGDLTGLQYRRAMETLAARDEARHPITIPGDGA